MPDRLTDEQWQAANHHLSVGISILFEAGMDQNEVQDMIDEVIENEKPPSENTYTPGPPKRKKP